MADDLAALRDQHRLIQEAVVELESESAKLRDRIASLILERIALMRKIKDMEKNAEREVTNG